MKKILITVLILVVSYFVVPKAFYLLRYAFLTLKPFDYSEVLSFSASHGYKGIILERMSFSGIGEIYLLDNNKKEQSVQKHKLEYYKEVSIFQDRKRLDPLDSFVKNFTPLTLSGDKNFIVSPEWNSGNFLGFIDISNYVNEPKIMVWEIMKIVDGFGTPQFGPYESLRNRLSPNGQYVIDIRKGDTIDSYPFGLYKIGEVSKEKFEQLYQPVPTLPNPLNISQLYTVPVRVFDKGEIPKDNYLSFTWTEDSKYLINRPSIVIPYTGGKDIWQIDAKDGSIKKLTSDFPLGAKIITAISPEEIIVDYEPGLMPGLMNATNINNFSPGTYLVKINQDNIMETKLLPNTVKFLGFVH